MKWKAIVEESLHTVDGDPVHSYNLGTSHEKQHIREFSPRIYRM
jgi:hypothetical protein